MTDSDSPVQRVLEDIHRRSMWQVLGIYLGGSWGVLEVLSELIDRLLLPETVFRVGLGLLAIGLPVVMATAFFESSRRRVAKGRGPEPGGAGSAGRVRPGRSFRRWFTWRNALLGGVGSFALLGVASTLFLGSRALGVGFAAPLIAQGVLDERQLLLLVDFENRTSDSLLSRAVTEALRVDLAQSPALRLVEPALVRATLVRMERDPDDELDEELAREVVRREGIKAYLTGAVDRLGGGYTVSARLVSTASGEDLIAMRESASGPGEIIGAVDRLSRALRVRIGESLRSMNASTPLPEVTTRSIDALERYGAGSQALRAGDHPLAIRHLEQAVRVDSTFASAHRALSVAHYNSGDIVRFDHYADLARRYSARLPIGERFMSAATFHVARGRLDSAVHYFELLLDTEPDHFTATSNLGTTYQLIGRAEEALAQHRRASRLQPDASIARVNLASVGRTLGMHGLADSAVAAMAAAGEPLAYMLSQKARNAIYALRDDALDSVLAESAASPDPGLRWLTLGVRGILAAKRGDPELALVMTDSSARVLDEAGAGRNAVIMRLGLVATSLAAERPDDALHLLTDWDIDARLHGSPTVHSVALALVARVHAAVGELAEAERILARADSLATTADFHQPGAVSNARGIVALARGDAEAALEYVRRAIEADFGLIRHDYRLTRALAYEALGHHGEAAREYESLTTSNGLFWMDVFQFPALLPLAHERAGAAFLAAGDTVAGARHLVAFVELWANAAPGLRPRVDAARTTIEAIRREGG